jgi:hypothetical protein
MRFLGEVRDVRDGARADAGSDFAVIEGKIRISIDSVLSQQMQRKGMCKLCQVLFYELNLE